MSSFWVGSVKEFLETPATAIIGTLAVAQIRHFRLNETQQLRAWEATIAILKSTLAAFQAEASWRILLEYPMLRLGRRPDVILLTDSAIFVVEIKAGSLSHTPADRRQVEDYAIDLHDFHAGSRDHPIIPILLAERAPAGTTYLPPISSKGVAPQLDATPETLSDLLAKLNLVTIRLARRSDAQAWLRAQYKPVPTIVDAACMLYAKHNVADIRAARSEAKNLRSTSEAILEEVARARQDAKRLILFVTGIPGAGKTLCGLNTIFGDDDAGRGTYLTGNPTLVHVLREALTRDAMLFGASRVDASRRMATAIQALPKFRDHYVANATHAPSERIVVVDESQRCWSASWAVAKTRDKAVPLTRSEPGHLLEAMSRHEGFCALVCLVGGGQEIHSGEGGLAEWGDALRHASGNGVAWRVRAAPDLLTTTDPRQRLGALEDLKTNPALHLDVSLRQIRSPAAAAWVDLVLAGNSDAARALAIESGNIPFLLTRDPVVMREWLRFNARGLRRSGLLASSGAGRLRTEGLGMELPHMDASAVAHWFLDRFPEDVRASDALEMVATEFSCQGLELDYVGLCWDADLIREPGKVPWGVRAFSGTKWQWRHQSEAIANRINTYRVLLTRARYETVIFIPRGSDNDSTRQCQHYDAIANFLLSCGARPATPQPSPSDVPEPMILLV